MKNLLLCFALFLSLHCFSQLTTPPDGGNKKAMVGERIGITDVTINYNRPGVKGREGKVFGKLVEYGFNDLGFGTSKAAPWRAGANENTTIEFSTNVKIEGKELPAGKYGFFIAVGPEESALIFSKNSTSWGSFFYKENEDALRVKVKNVPMPVSTEWLTYEFANQTPNSAVVNLVWEKMKFPFKIEVDLQQIQLESFRNELRTERGFTANAWHQAARYCLDNNINLEEGMIWSEKAISEPFIGEPNFATLSTKAKYLRKFGKETAADSIMKIALPMGSMTQIHNYARGLLQEKRNKEAFEVFKMNNDKNPNTFTTNMGMTRGYAAIGNLKKALEYAEKALPQAPDGGNRVAVEGIIANLKEGKDIN